MTIRENIAYGLVGSNVPDIEIVQAARIANAHNFIMEFPQVRIRKIFITV